MTGFVSFLDFLQRYSGALTALLTFVLAVATIAYVRLTSSLVAENRALREQAIAPKVVLSLEPHEGFINVVWLVIQNLGGGPAFAVRWSVLSGPPHAPLNERLAIPFFEKGLSVLSPHQRVELYVVNAIGNLDDLKSEPLVLEVSWNDSSGRRQTEQCSLDFGAWEGYARVGQPPLYEIASHLKSIDEDLGKIASGSAKLRVLSSSLEEHLDQDKMSALQIELHGLTPEEREALYKQVRGTRSARKGNQA